MDVGVEGINPTIAATSTTPTASIRQNIAARQSAMKSSVSCWHQSSKPLNVQKLQRRQLCVAPMLKVLLLLALLTLLLPSRASAFFPGGRLVTRSKAFIRNRRPRFRRVKMAPEKEKQSRMGVPSMPDNKPSIESSGLDVIEPVAKDDKPSKSKQEPPANIFTGLRNAFLGMFPVYKTPEEIRALEAANQSTPAATPSAATSPSDVQNGVEMSAVDSDATDNVGADQTSADAPKESASTAPKAIPPLPTVEEKSEATAATVSLENKMAPDVSDTNESEVKPSDPLNQPSKASIGQPDAVPEQEEPNIKEPRAEKPPPKPKPTAEELAAEAAKKIDLEKTMEVIARADVDSTLTYGTKTTADDGDDVIPDDILLESVKMAQQSVDGKIADFELDNLLGDEEEEPAVPQTSVVQQDSNAEAKMDPKEVAEATRKAVESYTKATSKSEDKEPSHDTTLSEAKTEEAPTPPDFATLTLRQLKVELGNRGLKKSGRKLELIARLEAYESGGTMEDTKSSTSDEGTSSTYASLKLPELKKELKRRGMKTSGRKAELINRLEQADAHDAAFEPVVPQDDSPEAASPEAASPGAASPDAASPDVSSPSAVSPIAAGRGGEPAKVVDALPPRLDYSSMTVALLQAELKLRGLPQRGRKAVLINRLEEDDSKSVGTAPDTSTAVAKTDFELPPLEPDLGEVTAGLAGNIEDLAKAARDAAAKFQTETMAASPEPPIDIELPELPVDMELPEMPVEMELPEIPVDMELPELPIDMEDDDEDEINGLDIPVFSEPITDWSKYSVGDLRKELGKRGLSTKGSRIELIASLETSDLQAMMVGTGFNQGGDSKDDPSALLDEIDFEAYDIEALSNAAKDAVLQFEAADEPTDEALWEIENEMDSEEDFEIPADILEMATTKVPPIPPPDYESMPVSQLKAELKSRGLRMTGKKVDLITRLQESD